MGTKKGGEDLMNWRKNLFALKFLLAHFKYFKAMLFSPLIGIKPSLMNEFFYSQVTVTVTIIQVTFLFFGPKTFWYRISGFFSKTRRDNQCNIS